MGVKLMSNLTISAICLYYLSEFGRFIAKHFFENRYYREESNMPTTIYLMHANSTFSV